MTIAEIHYFHYKTKQSERKEIEMAAINQNTFDEIAPGHLALWQKAASMAARCHNNQWRKDKITPYSAHPFRVAMILRHIFGVDDEAGPHPLKRRCGACDVVALTLEETSQEVLEVIGAGRSRRSEEHTSELQSH